MRFYFFILDLLQTEFRYDFRKGPRDISAGTVFTVFTVFICSLALITVNTVNSVLAEISRGPFRKSYRNSFCRRSIFLFLFFLLSIAQRIGSKPLIPPPAQFENSFVCLRCVKFWDEPLVSLLSPFLCPFFLPIRTALLNFVNVPISSFSGVDTWNWFVWTWWTNFRTFEGLRRKWRWNSISSFMHVVDWEHVVYACVRVYVFVHACVWHIYGLRTPKSSKSETVEITSLPSSNPSLTEIPLPKH